MKLMCPVCREWFRPTRRDAVTCSIKCRVKRSRLLQIVTPSLPAGPFDLIFADPPWDFATRSAKGQGRHPPYLCMDLAAICRLAIADLAAKDALLAIWVNGAGIRQTLQVIEAWGFGDISEPYEGLFWLKLNKAERPTILKGYATRKNAESVWFAKRGDGLRRVDRGVRQGFITEQEELESPLVVTTIGRRQHSQKPDEAYHALERLYGDVRRLELFARKSRPNWTAWGNEVADLVSAAAD